MEGRDARGAPSPGGSISPGKARGGRGEGRIAAYILSMTAEANSLHLTCLASSIKRAKS